jgi:uncharacterized protein
VRARSPATVTSWLAAGVGFAAAAALAAFEVPFMGGRVNDLATLLSVEEIGRLTSKLEAEEQRSGAQVAVLTVASLEGQAIEDYALRVAQTWKLGTAGHDNGVLMLIARDERRMRIEVGHGLEATLTDIATGRIQDNVMRPLFRAGDYGAGIEAGVDAILAMLQGGEAPAAAPAGGAADKWGGRLLGFGIYALVCGIFSLLALNSSGVQSWILYFFLMPFHLLFPVVLHPMLGGIMLIAWIVGFPILKAVLKRSGATAKPPGCLAAGAGSGGGGWTNGGGWHSSRGGWSSGGGGGFSGGGGSFGGGGSSSSW